MTTSHSTRERVAPAVRHRWRPRHAPRRCAAIRRPPPTKPQPAIRHIIALIWRRGKPRGLAAPSLRSGGS
eukprot:971698-Prorocentrum_minimum.AAC.1